MSMEYGKWSLVLTFNLKSPSIYFVERGVFGTRMVGFVKCLSKPNPSFKLNL